MIGSYRLREREFSASDNSDSDSDGDCWKRNKKKPILAVSASNGTESMPSPQIRESNTDSRGQKRKVNNIWSNVLEDQTMSQVLGDCVLKHKPITLQNRSCESYDFRQKYRDRRQSENSEEDMETNNAGEARLTDNRPRGKNGRIHLKRRDADVAKKISWRLNEKKNYLIGRVVYFLGAAKALDLMKQTEDIEDEGGMRVKNNSRRRTPGGVFFQLLKQDKDITKAQKNDIFAEEVVLTEEQKKNINREKKKRRNEMRKRKKKFLDPPKYLSGAKDMDTTGDVPAPSKEMVTAGGVCVKVKEMVTAGGVCVKEMDTAGSVCVKAEMVTAGGVHVKKEDMVAAGGVWVKEEMATTSDDPAKDNSEIEEGEITD